MTPQRQRPDSAEYHMQPRMDDDFDSVGMMAAIKAFLGGIGFVIVTPSVWPWAAVPALMMLGVTGVVTILGIWAGAELLDWVFGSNRGTWGAIGYWASWLLVIATVFVSAVLAALTLAQPLSGYALEKVAHAQGYKLTDIRRPNMSYFASLWLNCAPCYFPFRWAEAR
jgi:hypothetical protein